MSITTEKVTSITYSKEFSGKRKASIRLSGNNGYVSIGSELIEIYHHQSIHFDNTSELFEFIETLNELVQQVKENNP
jgi:hypothetical protein